MRCFSLFWAAFFGSACASNGPVPVGVDAAADAAFDLAFDSARDAGLDTAPGCMPSRCELPPSQCEGATRVHFANANCLDGTCVFQRLEETCEFGCDGGACDAAPSLCEANEHVVGGFCTPCESGATNAAGDDPAGEDTQCDLPDACSDVFGLPCDAFDEAYIKASNAETNDTFGDAVALSANTLVVGATEEDGSARAVNGDESNGRAESGAAYVFVRRDGRWTQEAYLKAENADSRDFFGNGVAIDGDTIVVGAPSEDSASADDPSDNRALESGAAYVFVRDGEGWRQQAYLKAFPVRAGAGFGTSVAIVGDTIAAVDDFGVYLFERRGDTWAPLQRLAPASLGPNRFRSVALADGVLAAGAYESGALSSEATDSGVAYVFERSAGRWSERAELRPEHGDPGDWFGRSIDVDGDVVVVGAPFEDSDVPTDGTNNEGRANGAAYVFRRAATGWLQEAYLKASSPGASDVFGIAVSVEGERIVVGAHGEDSMATGLNGDEANNAASDAGAAYLFVRDADAWGLAAYLKQDHPKSRTRFGEELDLDGGTLVVGAWGDTSLSVGVDGDGSDDASTFVGAVFVRRLEP